MAGQDRPHDPPRRGHRMTLWRDWRSAAGDPDAGPAVTVLHESPELKVVLVALGAGQGLPAHPGPAASFHFLDGHGEMTVGDDELAVSAGATVVVPTGAKRAVRARSTLVFLGNLGDPGSEDGPHEQRAVPRGALPGRNLPG